MVEPNPHRLPRSVVPRRYELVLEPDLRSSSFVGSVTVEVEVQSATDEVVLNSLELDIDGTSVTQGGSEIAVASVVTEEATERVTLTLARPVEPGPAAVSLQFRGVLNDKLRGFYRSRFTGEDGSEQVIATTQFEATDARRAFPCWDEPDLKAVFAVTLVVDDGLVAVSNARVVSDEPGGDGKRLVRFADTMPMSTYLVAFVVGPLETTEPRDVDGTPVRVICPPGKLHLTPFGLDVAEFSLRYFADYFDLPYPGDTLDLVAIPDFAFGAMENLGCITFRETLLLTDPDHATRTELLNVVDVIAHELAHMWFGDLVTMKWWNGIWLNEAFATFMELKATDAFRPDWERWVSFGLARSSAFDTDALTSTRPVEYPVISPEDAEGMFDVLTYEKGAAVVRMLEQYLGEDCFRDGIRRYMRTHRYGNTETTDLWDAIEEASGEPVRRIMDSWIFQGGHPVVEIDSAADGRTLRLRQERFRYLDPATGGRDADPGTWAVPVLLRYATADGDTHVRRVLLDDVAAEVELPQPAEWVVGNVEGNGFYRVRYSPSLRAALGSRAQQQLSALERYGLVDDTWGSVLAGATPAPEFLDLVDDFGGEDDVAVWRRIIGGLDQIERIASGPAADALRDRIAALVRPAFERVGSEPSPDEPDRRRELRGVLLGALGGLARDTGASALAAVLFDRYAHDPESVDADLVAAAARIVAAGAGPDELDAVLDRFRDAATPQEEQRFLYSLAEAREPAQFRRVLELAMSDEVRTQNAPFLIGTCLANRVNGALAWDLVEQRWDEMNERFPSNSIVRMLSGIRTISTADLAARVEAFLADHPVPQAKRTLDQHLERMRVAVELARRERDRLPV